MSEPIYKVYTAEIKNVDAENYTVDAVVTTQSSDRDDEIVSVQGFEKGLQEYRKHPVLLSCHEWRDLRKNIGQAEDFHFKDNAAEIKFRYFAGKGNEEADWAFHLAQEGIAAYSICFIPKDSRKPDDAEQAQGVKRVHTDFEVLEISQVLIPSNREALQVRQKMADIEGELCSRALQNAHLNLTDGDHSVLGLRVYGLRPIAADSEGIPDDFRPVDPEGSPARSVAIVGKPFENEHACRLRDPADFQDDSFRRTIRKHDGKEYSVIMGKLKGEDTMTEQAYRYKKDIWTASEARAHCKDHKGKFEPAKSINLDEAKKSMRGIFDIEGFTESANEHYHEFRMSKDLNGIIVGQTLWTFYLNHENDENMLMLGDRMSGQHKHLIIAREGTAEMEGHVHEITVFKSTSVIDEKTFVAKEGRTLSAATLATLQEVSAALETSIGKIKSLVDSATSVVDSATEVPLIITEAVDSIFDADIWTALRVFQNDGIKNMD